MDSKEDDLVDFYNIVHEIHAEQENDERRHALHFHRDRKVAYTRLWPDDRPDPPDALQSRFVDDPPDNLPSTTHLSNEIDLMDHAPQFTQDRELLHAYQRPGWHFLSTWVAAEREALESWLGGHTRTLSEFQFCAITQFRLAWLRQLIQASSHHNTMGGPSSAPVPPTVGVDRGGSMVLDTSTGPLDDERLERESGGYSADEESHSHPNAWDSDTAPSPYTTLPLPTLLRRLFYEDKSQFSSTESMLTFNLDIILAHAFHVLAQRSGRTYRAPRPDDRWAQLVAEHAGCMLQYLCIELSKVASARQPRGQLGRKSKTLKEALDWNSVLRAAQALVQPLPKLNDAGESEESGEDEEEDDMWVEDNLGYGTLSNLDEGKVFYRRFAVSEDRMMDAHDLVQPKPTRASLEALIVKQSERLQRDLRPRRPMGPGSIPPIVFRRARKRLCKIFTVAKEEFLGLESMADTDLDDLTSEGSETSDMFGSSTEFE